MMKRKSRSSSEAMDFMEFNKEATKLLREVQCLQVKMGGGGECTTPMGHSRHLGAGLLRLVTPQPENTCREVHALSPGHLENPQEAHTAKHRDPQGRHDFQLHQDGLGDPTAHHEAVKPVKERNEIGLETQAIHFYQHLAGEQSQEDFVSDIWKDRGSPRGCGSDPPTTSPQPVSAGNAPAPCPGLRDGRH